MTKAPHEIWVDIDSNEDGCCPVEDSPDGDGKFFELSNATHYISKDYHDSLCAVLVEERIQLAHALRVMGIDPIKIANLDLDEMNTIKERAFKPKLLITRLS